MMKKKKIPCFIKKKNFINQYSKNNVQFDFLTNYFVILKEFNHLILHPQDFIFKNKYLKLHLFRYKA